MDWPGQVAAFDKLLATMEPDPADRPTGNVSPRESKTSAAASMSLGGDSSSAGMSLGGGSSSAGMSAASMSPEKSAAETKTHKFIMDTSADDEMFAAGLREVDNMEQEFQRDADEFKAKYATPADDGKRPDVARIWTEISGRPEFVWEETKTEGKIQVFLWDEQERGRVQRLQAAIDLLRSYPSKSLDARVQFVLDTREKGPIRHLVLTVPQAVLGTCTNGDANVRINDKVHYITERKAYSDASAHIGTSVPEQHLRLLKCGLPRQQIEWIFEHEPLAKDRSRWCPQAHLDAWGASVKFRDGVKFEWRADMLDTVYHWMRQIEAYLKHGHMFVVADNHEQLMPLGDPDSGALLLKNHAQYLRHGISKAKAKTPDMQWEAQLAQIVGAGVATAIAKVYPTWESLSLAYMETYEKAGGGKAGETACMEMLVSIPYSAKPPKGGLKTVEAMEKKTTRAKQTHVYPAQSAAVYCSYKGQHKGPAKRKAATESNKRPAKRNKVAEDDDVE